MAAKKKSTKKQTTKTTKKPNQEEINAPKGFRDILGDEFYQYQGFFEKAQEVAMYYGFKPIELPLVEREVIYNRSIGEGTDVIDKEMYTLKPPRSRDKLAIRPEGTAGAMRAYIQNGMQALPQPVLLYYYGPFFRHDKPQRGRYRQFYQFGLEVLGTDKSIGDALVIHTTLLILQEAGFKNLVVDINSIGGEESRKQYIKELTAYYRKHINDLAAADRQRMKTNPLRVLDSKEAKTIAVNEGAPESVSYLSTSEKKHFKEVLEYLEELGITYRLNKNLVRGFDYYTNTVFEILEESDDDSDEQPLSVAGGGRYDNLAESLGHKKHIPAAGSAIGVDRIVESDCCKQLAPRVLKKPKVYFIQLGNNAKMKSIKIIESLRQAKVPVVQSLSRDKLSAQLGTAEKLKVPFVIIFGQKEALENSVIVRNMKNRSQKTVKIDELTDYLKKIK